MNPADPQLRPILGAAVEWGASDVYLTVGAPPVVRVQGALRPIAEWTFTAETLSAVLRSFATGAQLERFAQERDLDVAVTDPQHGRFRVNVHLQRGAVGIVVRRVRADVPSLEELGVPAALRTLAMAARGLVLVVGGTGSGKSTLTAAMVDHRNAHSGGHIITIEDPIEFLHHHKKCIVTQREVGVDTHSYGAALRTALRQAPDVVFIGEVRDPESMEAALGFADTGHLCLATMHAANASQAIERILGLFPAARHPQVLLQLSLNLRGIISQRLVPAHQGGRAAAIEVLLDVPRVRDLLREGNAEGLGDAMRAAEDEGCCTLDGALRRLHAAGVITTDVALANADSANDLRIALDGDALARGVSVPSHTVFRLRGEVAHDVRHGSMKPPTRA